MSANSFGERFKVTTFGESHGAALGVVIDGCPAGVKFDSELLQFDLDRRKPGQMGALTSTRSEPDQAEVLSGVYEGVTLGTPIAIMVRNQDARSSDYDQIKAQARTGHADDMWVAKFGVSDHRGGGRSSGRETVSRVMAGSVAKMLLDSLNLKTKVKGFVAQIGEQKISEQERQDFLISALTSDSFTARFPSPARASQVAQMLTDAKAQGESFGGIVEVVILDPPAQLGQPVFKKLKSDLASACLSVGATSGVLFGESELGSQSKGTEFHRASSSVYGGLRGGISTGESIQLQVLFKPTSSILDVAKAGRHDPSLVIRATPVIEAMIWLTLADHVLWQRTDRVL